MNFSEISQHKFCPDNLLHYCEVSFSCIIEVLCYIYQASIARLFLSSVEVNSLKQGPTSTFAKLVSSHHVFILGSGIGHSWNYFVLLHRKTCFVDIISYHQLKLILLRRWPTSTLPTWPLPTLYWPCSAYPFRWNHHHHHHHTYYHHNMVIITIIFDHISIVLDNLSGELIAITIIIRVVREDVNGVNHTFLDKVWVYSHLFR